MYMLLAGMAPAAGAFDSVAWMAERNDDTDAERLKNAYIEYVPKVNTPAENVKFPIEMYPNGTVKNRLMAGKAYLFPGTDFIWGERVRVEQYKEDGKTPDGVVLAEKCFFDRKTASGWVEGEAVVDWNGSRIRGHEVYFAFRREFVKIFAGTEIITDRLGKSGLNEVISKDKKPITTTNSNDVAGHAQITSVRTDYDRKNGVIHFDRYVSLEDPEYKMHADRLFVFLAGTNALRRLVAFGNVAITNGARRAYCDRATYLKSIGRITLYGNAAKKACLRESRINKHKQAEDTTLRGAIITFWHDSDQVEVIQPEIEMPGKGVSGLKEVGKNE